MKKITCDAVRDEEMQRKDVNHKENRLHIIDILLENNFDLTRLHDQINTFIVTVSTIGVTIFFYFYVVNSQ